MADRATERAVLAGRAAHTFDLRDPSEKIFRDAEGGAPMLVALPGDTMSAVFRRLNARYPDGANVVTEANNEVVLIVFDRVTAHLMTAEPVEDCPVHPDTHLSMLVAYLREHGAKIRCYEEAPDFELMLLPEPIA